MFSNKPIRTSAQLSAKRAKPSHEPGRGWSLVSSLRSTFRYGMPSTTAERQARSVVQRKVGLVSDRNSQPAGAADRSSGQRHDGQSASSQCLLRTSALSGRSRGGYVSIHLGSSQHGASCDCRDGGLLYTGSVIAYGLCSHYLPTASRADGSLTLHGAPIVSWKHRLEHLATDSGCSARRDMLRSNRKPPRPARAITLRETGAEDYRKIGQAKAEVVIRRRQQN